MSRDYVIINGTNSLTISGLAIKTLPPISKPLMRTMREEIDGRDGDINTELGYQAYDKPLEVGLFGNYDINEIIAFFNSKGTIVFSDEPDKFYNFEILDKIDFTKLVKFRTAMVNIHCQPFKYPTTETPIEVAYEYVEGTGESLTLDNTEASSLSLELKGNTSQTTYTGRNIFPNSESLASAISEQGQMTKTGSGRECTMTKTTTGTAFPRMTFDNSFFQTNTTYYISFKIKGNWSKFQFGSWINNQQQALTGDLTPTSNYTLVTCQFTYPSTKYTDDKFYFRNNDQYVLVGESLTITDFMISKTNNNEFEPYVGGIPSPNPNYPQDIHVVSGDNTITIANSDDTESQSYNVNLGTLELCKIRDYQDYIYKDNGSWYVHKEIGKVVLNGSEDWSGGTISGTLTRFSYPKSGLNSIAYTYGGTNGYCNYLPYFMAWSDTTPERVWTNGNSVLFVMNKTLSEFKTWLNTHNTIVYYVLATPTNTLIEDTTLIEQLEEIKSANSYEGQTNITQTNDNKPFRISASTLKKGSDTAVVNNTGNIYSKPTIELEGTGVVNIYKDGTQAFEVDLSEENNITIDTDKMEAYTDTSLANRKVTGDYSKFKLDSGTSNIKFDGALTSATITNYKRWL